MGFGAVWPLAALEMPPFLVFRKPASCARGYPLVSITPGGLCLFAKRLERGHFRLPRPQPDQASVGLSAADLAMLLSGIDWTRARRQQLYEPPRSLADRR